MPSPPGAVVAVGDVAALEAALLLILLTEPSEECFGAVLCSRFDAFGSAAGSVGPKDLNPPMLSAACCAWLGDAEKLDGLATDWPPCERLGVVERSGSWPETDGRLAAGIDGLGGLARMLAIFELNLPIGSLTIFLPDFLRVGMPEAGVEPLRPLGAAVGLSRGLAA